MRHKSALSPILSPSRPGRLLGACPRYISPFPEMIEIDNTPSTDALVALIPCIAPSAARSRILRAHYDNCIKASLRSLIHECSKIFSTLCPEQATLQSQWSRLTPRMHYLHHKLQSAMRAQCLTNVQHTLSQIGEEFAVCKCVPDFAPVASLGTADWERFVQLEGTRLSSTEQGRNDTPCPIAAHDLAACERHIYETLKTLRIVDGELHAEMREHVDEIKLFNSAVTQGFSDTRTMGAIFIRPPCVGSNVPLYFYEQLIHEMSHLQLHCLFSIDPLIDGDRYRLMASPIRSDPRPLFGVLHATYVSAKLANAFFSLYQRSKDETTLHYLDQIMDELAIGISSLRESSLTSSGRALVNSMTNLALRIAQDGAWSSFDLFTPTLHRRTRTWVTPDRFNRLRGTQSIKPSI